MNYRAAILYLFALSLITPAANAQKKQPPQEPVRIYLDYMIGPKGFQVFPRAFLAKIKDTQHQAFSDQHRGKPPCWRVEVHYEHTDGAYAIGYRLYFQQEENTQWHFRSAIRAGTTPEQAAEKLADAWKENFPNVIERADQLEDEYGIDSR